MSDPINPARELIDTEFPQPLRPMVPSALRRAYATVDALIDTTPWLDTPSGRFQRGDLIVKACEWEFKRLIETGSLPFEASWENYASPTGKHLVMRSAHARITIHQVDAPTTKPRQAVFRDIYATPNMEYLFPEWNAEIKKAQELKHLVVLHGHQTLSFANVAVPHPRMRWLLWYTTNLLNMPYEVGGVRSDEEGPSESPDPEAIENLFRAIRDAD